MEAENHLGEVVIEKISDPAVIEFLEIQRRQMEEEIRKHPEREKEIREETNRKVNNLLDWHEYNNVRWTIA